MKPIETDPDSGAETFQLTEGDRPTDNIYGEQPYSSPDGTRIVARHFPTDDCEGEIAFVDLNDGSSHSVFKGEPRFPAFHAWGEYLYYQEGDDDSLILKRCHFQTLEIEEILPLPVEEGFFSYGTVSPDHQYYAVSVREDKWARRVLLIEVSDGSRRTLAESPDQHFKHEQFSLDGRNRVLIQANGPETVVVNLGAMEVDREGVDWFPVDAPPVTPYGKWPGGDRHTPRCTGHESWVGVTDKVFFSTAYDEEQGTNIWTARLGDTAPVVACQTPMRFGHVSVSRCGRYWIGDVSREEGAPIYIGAFGSNTCRRLVYSRTVSDRNQSSHTHPYLTADNGWLIFNSTRPGRPQVHGAKVPKGLLEAL